MTDNPAAKDYFWFHHQFENLLQTDEFFSRIWEATPQISADEAHDLQRFGLMNSSTAEVEFHLRTRLSNVYKLTRRDELPESIDGTVLEALFNTLKH